MEWHRAASPRKKLKATPSSGKVMTNPFFGMQKVDFGTLYVTLKTLTQLFAMTLLKPCRSLS